MDSKLREKAITRTSIIGIISNIFLSAFKAGAGLISGSIAIVLDAVNNLTDALSSVITILGIKLARRSPDEKHPFGHGRVEYFSTILISLIVLFAGVTSIIESIKKILHSEMPEYSAVTIVIIVASVIVKLLLGSYVKKQGKKHNSDALVASGADASFDAIISASTLVGAIVAVAFHISIDGIIGAIISVFIIKAGIEMFLEAVSNVMGRRPDSEITKAIKATVREISPVIGAYDLVLHDYGPDSAIGSIHVEVPAELSAGEFHRLTSRIQQAVLEKFHVFLTVGIYAVDLVNEHKKGLRQQIIDAVTVFDGVLNAHGIFIDEDDKYISFDTTVDFTVKDRAALLRQIEAAVLNICPGYRVKVNFDTNFSD